MACRVRGAAHRSGWGGPGESLAPERAVRADERAPGALRRPRKRTAGPGGPAAHVRLRLRGEERPLRYFLGFSTSNFSISSMMPFISLIAELNGPDVVMSTPAPLSRSIGYLDEPEESIAR